MEIVNRKLLKWVFIVLVAATVILKIDDAFSQESIKKGYPPDAANRSPQPVPEFSLLSPATKGNSTERVLATAIPENFKSHPEYGKVKLENSPQSVELIQSRTANSRTFLNPDGSYTTTQSNGVMHYKDNAGNWMSISAVPGENSRMAGEFGLFETDKPISVNRNTGAGTVVLDENNAVEISKDAIVNILNASGQVISTVSRARSVNSDVSGNEINFRNYWNNIDRVQIIEADKLKTNYVLTTVPSELPADGYLSFTEKVTVPAGWNIRRGSVGKELSGNWFGSYEIVNSRGKVVGTFDKLFYFDNEENSEIEGGYKISSEGNVYHISALVPAAWLSDPKRVFPVTIDPTLSNTYSSGAIGSTYNAFCTVSKNAVIPGNSTVSSTTIASTYVASGTTKKRNARIIYTGPGGSTSEFYCNETTNGSCALTTTSTTIANGFTATGIIPFSIGVKRNNNSGAACNSTYLSVTNNTWVITLTYTTCATPTAGGTLSGPTTASCGDANAYSCSGGSGTYLWEYSSNGGTTYTTVSGATTSSTTISFNTTGTYLVRVKREATGCSTSTSNVITTVVSTPTQGVSTATAVVIPSLPYSGLHNTYCYPTTFSGSGNQATAAKFFKFTTGSCANKVTINTCDVTSIFDTYIFLLNSAGTVIASNDDYNGCAYLVNGNAYLSRILDFTVTPSTDYYVVVQAYRYASPASGTFGLNISESGGSIVVPSVSISGGATICSGEQLTLTATPVNGGTSPTYSWTVNGNPAGNGTATFTSSSLANGDQIAVTMTSNQACASPATATSSTYTAVVGSGPVISTSSNSPLCHGADLMLNVNVSESVSGFSWTGPGSFSSADQNPVISSGSISNEGTYTVVVTGLSGCTSSSSTIVDYSTELNASVQSFQNPSCTGLSNGTIEIALTGGTAPITYMWSDGQSTSTASNLAAGPYAVTIFDANGCTSYVEQELNTPDPISPAVAGDDREVCNLLSLQMQATAPFSGTGTWTIVSGSGNIADIHTATTTISNLGTTQNNIFKWTVSNGCDSLSDEVSIRVYTAPPPNQPSVTGPLIGCEGDTLSFQTNLSAPQLVWEARPAGSIIEGQGTRSAKIIFGQTTATGFHACVTGSNACGSNVVKCLAVRTNTSVPKLLVAPADVCEGTTVEFKSNAIAGAVNYKWTATGGVTFNGQPSPFTTTDTSVAVFFPAGFTSTKVGVASTAGCAYSNVREVTVSATPAIPYTITGLRGNLCNSEQLYFIRTRANQTYEWSVPTGASITWTSAGTDSIRVQFGNSVTGNITVKAINICGIRGPERKLAVTSNPSIPGVVSGLPEACPLNSGYQYSVAPVSGATAYRWTLPSGAVINSGDGTPNIDVTFGPTVGRISVATIGSCGVSGNRYFNIASICRTAGSPEPEVTSSKSDFNLQAFPDSESKILTITFNSDKAGSYNFKLLNQAGTEMSSGEINAVKGSNMEQIDMSALPNAIYRLVVESPEKSQQLTVRFF